MKNIRTLTIALLFIVLGTGCMDHHRIHGNYSVKTQYRNIENFTGVVAEGNYSVYLIQDSISYVEVEAEENLIPYIITYVQGTELTVKQKNHRVLKNHYPIKVFVHTPDINNIRLSGSGNIYADSISTQNLALKINGSGNMIVGVTASRMLAEINGSGDLELSGMVSEANMKINGSGEIYAYNLMQDTCYASISGSGSMYLWVQKMLNAKITGSGSIHYIGNPYVTVNIDGSGQLIHE